MDQFRTIPQAEIDAFPYRLGLLKLQEKLVKGKRPGYMDSGPMALFHILFAAFQGGWWISLDAALRELERLYGYENVVTIVGEFSQIICGEKKKS